MKTTSQAAVFRLQDSDASAGRLFTLMRRAIMILTVLWGVLSGAAALAAQDLDSDGDVDGRDLWQYLDAGIFSDIGLFAGAYGGFSPPGPGDDWWKPKVTDTWQWQLSGTVNTTYDVDVYDIDLFESSAELIAALHGSGRKVVCYFEAGGYEDWRPDKDDFNPEDLGNTMDGWPDERWLDIRSANVREIMKARLDLAAQKGCDGVEPDNMAGYNENTGFPLTAQDQLDYNRFLSREAHSRNLAIALKNDIEQAADLAADFDFSVNEQCHEYDECGGLAVFINAGKPVFNAEYAYDHTDTDAMQTLCADALNRDFRTLVLPLGLDDSFRYSCDGGNTNDPADSEYPMHMDITATVFWAGEPQGGGSSEDNALTAYDDAWVEHYGGYDDPFYNRTAENDFFPTHMTPLENPFYLDLPYDDLNVSKNFQERTSVIPWAAGEPNLQEYSFMKNRWVRLVKGDRVCYGQIEDAGPYVYDDKNYVFGSNDERPASAKAKNAGMDVSPSLRDCLGFVGQNNADNKVDWQFVEEEDVPRGPWTRVITTSGVYQP